MTDQQQSFLARLKQHHLYGVVVAYAVVVGFLIQLVSRAFPYFGWAGAVPAVIIVLLLGFPLVVVLAWLLIKPKDPAQSGTWQRRHWKLSATVTVMVIVLVAISGFYGLRFSEGRAEHLAALSVARSVPTGTAASSAAPAAATIIPAKSVAVLPFVNESGDKDQQYFSDGLSEDLITALSQFSSLKVISRDSSFRFRHSNDSSAKIGEKLGVAHLLEGSVQRAGGEVRISVELVEAANGTTLWSQQYDRPYTDVFKLQDAITQAVAGVLKTKLLLAPGAVVQSDRPPSGNLAAWNAYLKGQFYYQRDTETDLRKAIAEFADATRLDPNYAAAYAWSAQSWTLLAGYFLSGAEILRAYTHARISIDMALRLNPDLALAHATNAAVLTNADFDWAGAQASNRRALELAPANALVLFDLSTNEATHGDLQSAMTFVRKALARDPQYAFWYDWLASYLAALGQFDEAAAAAQKAIALQPQAPLGSRELTYIEVLRGDAAAALAAAQKGPPGRNRDIALAWALQLGSDRAAADAALAHLIATDAGNSSYQIAEVYALRRDPDNLFKWLDQAWTNRDNGIQYLLYDPMILRYQHDPRFAAFCKKVGLPTTTDAKAMP